MKNNFKKVLGVGLAAVLTMGAVGCGPTEVEIDPESDGKRIEIKATVAGFGTGWLTEIVKSFNETYKAQGYEAVVTQEDPEISARNEITTPKDCTTDIYFQYTDLITSVLDRSRQVLKSDKALLVDLSDVLNSPAVNPQGEEEGKPIKERIIGKIEDSMAYKGRLQGFDGLYGMPWQGGTTGVYINKNILAEYDYTLDDILTTDDFLAVVDDIAPEPTEENLLNPDNVFPVSWSPQKAPGYWEYLFNPLFAQYEGLESFKNFWEFIPDEGTQVEKGYTVYEKEGLREALKVLEKLLNKDYSAPGTTSMDHVQMQSRVATGKSFMVVTGDWVYKELESDYANYMENLIAIKTPVISALGVKLKLCGVNHATTDSCANCNAKLRNIVKAVDDGEKTDAQIATEVGTSESNVARIREARGYYESGYYDCAAVIPAFSDAIKGSKLFLRYMYSDAMMKKYREATYVDLPATYTVEPEQSQYAFVNAIYERMFSNNAKNYIARGLTPLRTLAKVQLFPNEGNLGVIANGLSYSHSHAAETQAQYTVQGIFNNNIEYVKVSWGDYIHQAGLD